MDYQIQTSSAVQSYPHTVNSNDFNTGSYKTLECFTYSNSDDEELLGKFCFNIALDKEFKEETDKFL